MEGVSLSESMMRRRSSSTASGRPALTVAMSSRQSDPVTIHLRFSPGRSIHLLVPGIEEHETLGAVGPGVGEHLIDVGLGNAHGLLVAQSVAE